MDFTVSNHPNPQFERKNIEILNGKWDFGFKKAKKGFKFSTDEKRAVEIRNKNEYPHKINVPFCVESELSGIQYKDFINMVWYKKMVEIKKTNSRVFLCFGAADHLTTVLVNGKLAGRHKGGYTSFKFDITDLAVDGENEIFVLCEDDVKNQFVIRGKQSEWKKSHACDYTRTTGIWQTVFIEYVPENYIENFKIYPDHKNGLVTINFNLKGKENLTCEAFYNGKSVGKSTFIDASDNAVMQLKLDKTHLWEVGNGQLYDLEITFGEDKVYSYFGLRNVRLDGYKFLINEKSVFQRLVLDQGFYKKGIYTAPSDEDLMKDIELSMALGFNGARLHQKVFDPRFLYFCDKMGYIVWGEYANWGLDYSNPKSVDVFLNEWKEALERDFNHPAIIGWCPFNETWNYKGRPQYDPLLSTVYDYTKAIDNTRPCIDTSGNYHVKTDIFDLHDYSYDVDFFKKNYDRFMTEDYLYQHVLVENKGRQTYRGEPVFISEYGGIKWVSDESIKSWGYGEDVKTPEEFADRYVGLTDVILSNYKMFGFCYTQLYDIEQEQNGLYTYDREKKFDDAIYDRIIAINTKVAEIEKE
ncbi:MAG: beta-galactosidase [Clostridia bacterium]|nr:beta-galactosidase [Clostridia bacterium]